MVGEPYVLLGCGDGSVRIAALLNDKGQAPEAVSPIASIEMRPYTSASHFVNSQ